MTRTAKESSTDLYYDDTLYAQIKDEDWSLVGNAIRNVWPHRLWDMKKSYQWNGGSGGAGVGYNLPASVGAAQNACMSFSSSEASSRKWR